jgi:hypothetical protein
MTTSELRELMHEGRAAVAAGELTLRQLVGLTDAEEAALARHARRLAGRGRLHEAEALCGLLCSADPLQARHWQALARLQRRLGRPIEARACDEIARCLADEQPPSAPLRA